MQNYSAFSSFNAEKPSFALKSHAWHQLGRNRTNKSSIAFRAVSVCTSLKEPEIWLPKFPPLQISSPPGNRFSSPPAPATLPAKLGGPLPIVLRNWALGPRGDEGGRLKDPTAGVRVRMPPKLASSQHLGYKRRAQRWERPCHLQTRPDWPAGRKGRDLAKLRPQPWPQKLQNFFLVPWSGTRGLGRAASGAQRCVVTEEQTGRWTRVFQLPNEYIVLGRLNLNSKTFTLELVRVLFDLGAFGEHTMRVVLSHHS